MGKGERVGVDAQSGTGNRSNLEKALKIVAVLYAVLVLIQAILAGRGWFKDLDLIKTHGRIGDGIFLIVIVQLVLAYLVFGPRNILTIGFAVVMLLTFAQLGLGYSGRDSSTAASLHVPNGVLIFGLTCVLTSRVVGGGASLKTRA